MTSWHGNAFLCYWPFVRGILHRWFEKPWRPCDVTVMERPTDNHRLSWICSVYELFAFYFYRYHFQIHHFLEQKSWFAIRLCQDNLYHKWTWLSKWHVMLTCSTKHECMNGTNWLIYHMAFNGLAMQGTRASAAWLVSDYPKTTSQQRNNCLCTFWPYSLSSLALFVCTTNFGQLIKKKLLGYSRVNGIG